MYEPKHRDCWVTDKVTQEQQPAKCTLLLTEDFQQIVIELKTACLALGGTPEECQTVPNQERL